MISNEVTQVLVAFAWSEMVCLGSNRHGAYDEYEPYRSLDQWSDPGRFTSDLIKYPNITHEGSTVQTGFNDFPVIVHSFKKPLDSRHVAHGIFRSPFILNCSDSIVHIAQAADFEFLFLLVCQVDGKAIQRARESAAGRAPSHYDCRQ